MPFLQLSFEFDSLDPEEIEAVCFSAGAVSLTLTDAADAPILEPEPNATPLWPQVHASALFALDADRQSILQRLEQAFEDRLRECSFSELADRVWEREWLAGFKPMQFGKRLWVCPHEQELSVHDAIVVRLDPGLAFGAGTHPTTAMCLQWLDGAQLTDKRAIDYGCGSGILAIAAVKLGAHHVYAVDHDAQALIAARDNATRNNVENRVTTLPPAALLDPADVLLANILAQPLIQLAPRLRELVSPGGHLVLSGILFAQAEAVASAYSPHFQLTVIGEREGWVCLHAQCKG